MFEGEPTGQWQEGSAPPSEDREPGCSMPWQCRKDYTSIVSAV